MRRRENEREGKRKREKGAVYSEKKKKRTVTVIFLFPFSLKFHVRVNAGTDLSFARESRESRNVSVRGSPTTVIDFPRDALTRAALVREFARVK